MKKSFLMKTFSMTVGLASMLFLSSPSYGDTIIECGESEGWFYYIEDDVYVSAEDSGWSRDTISQGGIALTVSPDDELDILFKDTEGMKSALSYGAKIVPVGQVDDTISVLVLYPPKTTELYTFHLKRKFVLWSQHKFGSLINKAGTLRAECK